MIIILSIIVVGKMDAETLILKAKIRLQKNNPFFAYLVANLKFIRKDEVVTMAVDINGNCYYNSKFVDGLRLEEIECVITHEVLHIVFEHLIRGKHLESQELMNVACDMVINNMLVGNNFYLPNGSIIPYNNSFTFMGVEIEKINKKTAIMIYQELLQKLKDKGKIKYVGLDEHIYSEKGKDITNEQISKNKDNVKQMVGSASAFAKQRGDIPDGLKVFIEEFLDEKIDWKSLLYKHITAVLPFDYTYRRPSKRSIASGFYMPSILKESVEIVVSLDTSGSISKRELTEFMTEIRAILKSFRNIKMKLLVADSEIHNVYDLGNGDTDILKDLALNGGGGTSHKPIYNYIKQNIPNTRLVINFTDGYTSYPQEEEVKTIWALTSNSCDDENLRWGEIIRISLNDTY